MDQVHLLLMPKPSELLNSKFPYEPTEGQKLLFDHFDHFIDNTHDRSVLMIKGYAGTGKTTIISAMVKVLPLLNKKFVLMAPTGRAAKVMSAYSERMAFTIHKKIYKQIGEQGEGPLFSLQTNYAKSTIFIVDEASMISEDNIGSSGLLPDLFSYVFAHQSNKLVLIGDDAQLPPVGQSVSPGLNADYLRSKFSADVEVITLTEVMRQEEGSGILQNATDLRNQLTQSQPTIKFRTRQHADIFRMSGDKMEDGLRYAYDNYGIENSIIICRSNKTANQYNQYIRNQIHFYESEIEVGEILMIVRNNYVYSPGETTGGFLANGDFVEIRKIVTFEEMHGFRFATLLLCLVDYPTESTFEARVILDTLHTTSPALSDEQHKQLYNAVLRDYEDITSKKERREALKKDLYLNALQVKFAYALTCHKAQGGQWNVVFIDQGYLKDEDISKDYIRWLYTALTRGTEKVFLLNFNPVMYV